MPTYDFKCTDCGEITEMFLSTTTKSSIECPKCGGNAERGIWRPYKSQFVIKNKWRTVAKDNKAIDDGIPFGEVPGDDDYIGIDKPGYNGPIP